MCWASSTGTGRATAGDAKEAPGGHAVCKCHRGRAGPLVIDTAGKISTFVDTGGAAHAGRGGFDRQACQLLPAAELRNPPSAAPRCCRHPIHYHYRPQVRVRLPVPLWLGSSVPSRQSQLYDKAKEHVSSTPLRVMSASQPAIHRTALPSLATSMLLSTHKGVGRRVRDESISAIILRVNTAYHSHNMLPCSSPYIQTLTECLIINAALAGVELPSTGCLERGTNDLDAFAGALRYL